MINTLKVGGTIVKHLRLQSSQHDPNYINWFSNNQVWDTNQIYLVFHGKTISLIYWIYKWQTLYKNVVRLPFLINQAYCIHLREPLKQCKPCHNMMGWQKDEVLFDEWLIVSILTKPTKLDRFNELLLSWLISFVRRLLISHFFLSCQRSILF